MIEFEVSKWLTNKEKRRVEHIKNCVIGAQHLEEIRAYKKEMERIIKKAWLRKERECHTIHLGAIRMEELYLQWYRAWHSRDESLSCEILEQINVELQANKYTLENLVKIFSKSTVLIKNLNYDDFYKPRSFFNYGNNSKLSAIEIKNFKGTLIIVI